MVLISKISILIGAFISIYFFTVVYSQARGSSKYKSVRIENSKTFVTPKVNPEHYLRFNASRTCGKGFNSMSKLHRQHHRYKRPHGHSYPPWRQGCSE